jgi:hypothetical protein
MQAMAPGIQSSRFSHFRLDVNGVNQARCELSCRYRESSSMPSDSLHLAGEELGEPLEVQRPTLATIDTIMQALPAFTMPLQSPVLDLDTRPLGRLCGEANLPFT